VDIETRRKKQKALMQRMLERKVRSRAQQIYELRGQGEGKELEDWFQAESEILENRAIANLYRRLKSTADVESQEQADVAEEKPSTCETSA
jgi:hypothetical protein